MKYRNAALITLVLSAVMMVGPGIERGNVNLGPINVYAAEITNTWDSGNTTVTLDSEGTLTVTAKPGTDGRMADYPSSTYEPWKNNGSIQSIVITDGVTHLGRFAFYSLPNATKIVINANNLDLHNNVFQLCGTSGILDLELDGSIIAWGASTFANCKVSGNLINEVMKDTSKLGSGTFTDATIPDGTVFDFSNSENIPYTFLKNSTGEYSVIVNKDKLISIGDNAFAYSGITDINLDGEFNKLTYLGENAFSNNTVRTRWRKEHFIINAPNCTVKYLGSLYGIDTLEIKAKNFEGGVCPKANTLKVEVTGNLVKNKNFGGQDVEYIYVKAPKLPQTDVYYSSKTYSRNFIIGTPQLKEVHLDVDEVEALAFYANDPSGNKDSWGVRISRDDKKDAGVWSSYLDSGWYTEDKGTYKVILDRIPDKIGIGSFIGVTVELPTSELTYDNIPSSAFSDSKIITPNNELTLITNSVGNSSFYNINEGTPLSKLRIVGKDQDLSISANSFRTAHINNLEIDRLGDTTWKFPIGVMLDYLSGSSNVEKYKEYNLKTVKISNLNGKLKLEQSGIEERADCGFFSNNKGLESVEISGTGSLEASNYAFNGLDKLTLDIDVPISLVGGQSFSGVKNLGNLELSCDTVGKMAFNESSGIINAPSLSNFGEAAFQKFNGSLICKPIAGTVVRKLFMGATIDNFDSSLDLANITVINESAFEGSNLDLSDKSMPNLNTIGPNGLKDTICKGATFPSLDNLGTDGLNGTGVSLDGLDMQKLSVYADRSLYNNGITDLVLDSSWAKFNPSAFNELTRIIAMPEISNFYGDMSHLKNLEKLYILGGISSNMEKQYIPSITRVYCIANTTAHSWCESEGVPYTLLTDEEVDGLINGALPTLEANTFLFDYDTPSEITLNVTLGEKPAGATDVSKLIIDNETVEDANWQFDGTDTITINVDYLKTLPNGTHSISVLFNNNTFRSGASVTVVNSIYNNGGTTPPEVLDTITYEFYKDYPDVLIVPVKLNGATGLKELKIGTEVVDPQYYEIQDGAIIVSIDYLSTLAPAKYRFIPTFNDKASTVVSNVRIIVYEKAADRAAPYLLQTRLVFSGQPIVLNFEPGEGDLQASNVLALVLDDEVILPNGERLPFSKTNTTRIKEAYQLSLEVDKPYIIDPEEEKDVATATPSDATKKEDIIEPDKATPSEATPKDEVTEEDSDTEEEIDVATPSEAKQTKGLIDKVEATQEEKERLINIMAELEYSSDNVFTVEGTTITVDGEYIASLNLSAGDHLIGAIFDNTERTTDVKKVILTIPDNGSNTPDPDDKPDPTPDEKPTPDTKPDPTPDEKPTPDTKPDPTPDNGGNSGGNGGSSGGSGGGSKPSGNGNGSNNSSNIPDTGGNWSGSGDDWTYIKPDGNPAHSEWVGDGKNWYYIDENGKLKFDWFQDPATGIWYMLNRDHDGTFGAALKGWYFEKQDNKWYYLSTINNKMLTGWQLINGEWYYLTAFNEGPTYFGDNINGWKFDSTKGQRPYGSLWVNETTPDGYKVNENGAWIK